MASEKHDGELAKYGERNVMKIEDGGERDATAKELRYQEEIQIAGQDDTLYTELYHQSIGPLQKCITRVENSAMYEILSTLVDKSNADNGILSHHQVIRVIDATKL